MNRNGIVVRLCVLVGTVAALAGCGGGGGDSTTAAPPAVVGAIDGVAAKGILKNAKVTAYCGNSEAAADMLSSGSTDSAGAYSLKWTIACTGPLKLVVELSTGTTMADEATGTDVTPSAGFKLSALVADPSTTPTKNITPFTNMAVAVAGTASTKEAIANAELAIVNTVLGGDLGAYQAKPVAPTALGLATASADEKKLATLLTAVSAFAQDDATCSAKTAAGDKIKCAVDTLTTQAAATVTAVSATGYTVAATVPASTPASSLSATMTKLTAGTIAGVTATNLATEITSDGSGASTLLKSGEASVATAAAGGGNVTAPVVASSGVQAAKDLFNSLKTDLSALSNGNGDGFLDQKLSAMKTDFSTNNVSATELLNYMNALNRATQMAMDAKTANWTVTDTLQANSAYVVPSTSYPNVVVMLTDSTAAPAAYVRSFLGGDSRMVGIACGGTATPSCSTAINGLMPTYAIQPAMNCIVLASEKSLGKASCYDNFGQAAIPFTGTSSQPTSFPASYRAFEVAASATTSDSYAWNSYTASRTYTNQTYYVPGSMSPPIYGIAALIPSSSAPVVGTEFKGTAVATRDSTGNITALAINGDVPPLSVDADKSTMALNATLTTTASTKTLDLTGSINNVKGATTIASIALASGSKIVGALATATANDHVTLTNLITQIKTSTFQYDGTLTMDTFVAELGSGNYQPGNASFTGKISTVANGTATEFLFGTLGMKQTNLVDYNPTKPSSATNFLKRTASFTGKVTNGAANYVLTFIADGSTYGQDSMTMNYANTGNALISITGTKVNGISTLTLKGVGDVSAVLTDGTGDVSVGGTRVGSITNHPSQVIFTDGTYLLLGI